MSEAVEVEVTVPESDSNDDTSAVVDAVALTVGMDHEQRITRLEERVNTLESNVAGAQVTAEVAATVAESASAAAQTALDVAIDAEITADSTAEAVEEIAETTETPVDDEIVAEVIVQPDEPVRQPNRWFDDSNLLGLGRK
jgi:hypothetical protein